MPKKQITTDQLAVMIKRGFDDTAKKKDLDEVKFQVGHIEERLENIEKLLLKQHSFQIQNHEKRLKRIESLMAVIGEK